jgi:hypothetical protein
MCNVTPPPHSGGGCNISVKEPAGKLGENYGLNCLKVTEIKHNYLLSMNLLSMNILSITRIKHSVY